VSHPLKSYKSQERRKARPLSPPVDDYKQHAAKRVKTRDTVAPRTPAFNFRDDDDFVHNFDDDEVLLSDPQPSSPVVKAVERKAQVAVKTEEEDEEMEVAQADGIAAASVNISGARPIPKVVKSDPYPSPASSSPTRAPVAGIDASDWNDVTQKLNVVSSNAANDSHSFGKLDHKDAIEEDGSLRMFWTDYTEVNGSLCLFGKAKDKRNGSFVSCFVKVDNILRKLFFLPREYRQRHGRDTNEEVSMKDVYEEVDELMGKMNVGMHKIKPCTRKYAFELPDIPKEGEYLKLLYPYTSGWCILPINKCISDRTQNLRYPQTKPEPPFLMSSGRTQHSLNNLCSGRT
jgi:DNA polymerase alpha subunit A